MKPRKKCPAPIIVDPRLNTEKRVFNDKSFWAVKKTAQSLELLKNSVFIKELQSLRYPCLCLSAKLAGSPRRFLFYFMKLNLYNVFMFHRKDATFVCYSRIFTVEVFWVFQSFMRLEPFSIKLHLLLVRLRFEKKDARGDPIRVCHTTKLAQKFRSYEKSRKWIFKFF